MRLRALSTLHPSWHSPRSLSWPLAGRRRFDLPLAPCLKCRALDASLTTQAWPMMSAPCAQHLRWTRAMSS